LGSRFPWNNVVPRCGEMFSFSLGNDAKAYYSLWALCDRFIDLNVCFDKLRAIFDNGVMVLFQWIDFMQESSWHRCRRFNLMHHSDAGGST
jgi:hypothetical protein